MGAALSNDDAAGFRLKYTQLTLNWPAPIMGPARTDAYSFGQQECMVGRRCSSLVLRRRRSWLFWRADKRISSSRTAYPEIRARDRHHGRSSRRVERTRASLYLSNVRKSSSLRTIFISGFSTGERERKRGRRNEARMKHNGRDLFGSEFLEPTSNAIASGRTCCLERRMADRNVSSTIGDTREPK